MTRRDQENLLGYLLGVLDADERDRVEAALAVDEELRRERDRLLERLAALPPDDQPPPAGLAERTCDLVDMYRPKPASRGGKLPEKSRRAVAARFEPAVVR